MPPAVMLRSEETFMLGGNDIDCQWKWETVNVNRTLTQTLPQLYIAGLPPELPSKVLQPIEAQTRERKHLAFCGFCCNDCSLNKTSAVN